MKEGRNRQIRRIAEHIGFMVLDLKIILFGDFSLENLNGGDWKIINKLLIQDEIIKNDL